MKKLFLRAPSVWFACGVFAVVMVMLVVPQLLTAYDPLATNAAAAFEPPSPEHPLGTDQVGRDVWARIVYGARSSILVGLVATVTALILGVFFGTAIASLPRAANFTLRRGVDVIMALPEFLLALFIVALLGPGPLSVLIAIAIAAIPAYVNVSRASALTARQSDSVFSARVLGLSPARIFTRYVGGEAVRPALALFPLGVSFAILTAASLSFLGLGVQPPSPDWGVMLAEARAYLTRAWWLMVFPGVMLTLSVAAFALLGRWLQQRVSS